MGLFEVDIRGFKQTLVGEAPRILTEPIANAFDTEATEVTVSIIWTGGVAEYEVIDNDPEGFSSLKDAYTLFAPSTRKGDAEKRGRFGVGEKEFIALCWPGEVTIATTTGTVLFSGDERTDYPRRKRTNGSSVRARFRLPKEDFLAFVKRVHAIIPPPETKFTVRWGERYAMETPRQTPRLVRTFDVILPTVHEDEEGNLRPTRRSTTVRLYEPESGETPTIYELGVPVVAHEGRFHINVGQKVPLNRNRDNVPPSYLKKLREVVLNETYDLLTSVDAKSAWVTEALPNAAPEALTKVVTAIHGANAVIADPSNPEATKKAVEEGRTVIHGRQFPTAVWSRIREEEIFKPAGQVIKTGVPTSPDGQPPIPQEQWTDDMLALAAYTVDAGEHLLGVHVTVRFQNLSRFQGFSGDFAAWWSGGTITFNLGVLGKRWPGEASQEDVDALLIHEFAHNKTNDHYSAAFYGECCRLGAKLRTFTGVIR